MFPLWLGALVTVILEVFFIVTQRYHKMEKYILAFLGVKSVCYLIEVFIVKPNWIQLAPAIVVPRIS